MLSGTTLGQRREGWDGGGDGVVTTRICDTVVNLETSELSLGMSSELK